MSKYIKLILIFFAIVAAIDICVGSVGDYLVSHVKSGDTKRTNDLVMIDEHDVLILGSSRARHHYDTPFLSDTLGLDVYNAGYDGNGVILAYGLLEMILERYQPKLIIYDVEPAFDINVYADDNNHKRYISRLKPYYRHKTVRDIIKDVSTEEWIKVHSGMMRYNTSIITMLNDGLRKSKMDNKGFSPLEGVFNREPQLTGGTSIYDPLKLEYVKRLLSLAKQRQIPIVVVASPKYGKSNSSDLKPIEEICAERGVAFFDYYADYDFMQHKDWFKEPMHLNSVGAREFSMKLTAGIKELLQVI